MANEERVIALKLLIAEADAAYHQLMTGGSARVFVDQNAERIEYTAVNKNNLWAYLIQLKAELCQLAPTDPICIMSGMGRAQGPVRFTF